MHLAVLTWLLLVARAATDTEGNDPLGDNTIQEEGLDGIETDIHLLDTEIESLFQELEQEGESNDAE